MNRIKTAIIKVDPNDDAYFELSKLSIINAGAYENKIFFNDLEDFQRYHHKTGWHSHSRDEIKRICNEKPSIAVAGQTKLGENTVIQLAHSMPDLVAIRYSSFYGKQDYGYAFTTDISGNTKIGRQYRVSMSYAGYSLDCPKNLEALMKLISNEKIIGSIIEKDRKSLKNAIDELNMELPRPIKFTKYFDKLFMKK